MTMHPATFDLNADFTNEPLVGEITDCIFPGRNPCGARRKRSRSLCRQFAMKNGKCRFHGGKSTGPQTPKGKEKSRMANYKHGEYSQAAIDRHREVVATLKECKKAFKEMARVGLF